QRRRVILPALAVHPRAELRAGEARRLTRQMQEEIDAVRAQVAQAAAAGNGGIEHPWRIPGRIARRRRAIEPEVQMRERTEAALVEHATGAGDERLIALRQRYRD